MTQNENIAANLQKVRDTLPDGVRLVAVSKTKPVEAIRQAYEAGQRCFGENKALELRDKHDALPDDIQWHFVGHLQSNKVKYIAPFVALIHSIDSLALLQTVEKEACKNGRVIDCLLQFHIADEETKFGFTEEEAWQMLSSPAFAALQHVRIVGVMGMATHTDRQTQVRDEFRHLRLLFDRLKQRFFASDDAFSEVSMGMSGDYLLAVEEGSTMVRIGSTLFGARDYGVAVND